MKIGRFESRGAVEMSKVRVGESEIAKRAELEECRNPGLLRVALLRANSTRSSKLSLTLN